MLCPFINDECTSNCIFNNFNCQILEGISLLKEISNNTGKDHTYSSSIDTIVGEISDKLDIITQK